MRTMLEGLCSGAGSVTTEDRGRHADHARGIVFGCGVGDYRGYREPPRGSEIASEDVRGIE